MGRRPASKDWSGKRPPPGRPARKDWSGTRPPNPVAKVRQGVTPLPPDGRNRNREPWSVLTRNVNWRLYFSKIKPKFTCPIIAINAHSRNILSGTLTRYCKQCQWLNMRHTLLRTFSFHKLLGISNKTEYQHSSKIVDCGYLVNIFSLVSPI